MTLLRLLKKSGLIMSKIYLPTEFLNKPCYQINNDYIRVYNSTNVNQQNVIYDIYINQDYMVRQSTSNYSNTTVCDRLNTFTDNVYYRVDFVNIIIIFFVLCLICFILPLKIFTRLFRKWIV